MKKMLWAMLLLGLSWQAWGDGVVESGPALYQVSTIDALLSGVYDGQVTIGELARHGDFGIGTFNGLDGEMLAFDGAFYQVKADGVAYPASPSLKTPFADVLPFKGRVSMTPPAGTSLVELERWLDQRLGNLNLFYAIRIDGAFEHMKTRAVPAQKKPYPLLAEVVKTQPVFDLGAISGVLVGLRAPAFSKGVSVPGYHWHFLSADKKSGGHVLGFSLGEVTARIDPVHEFRLDLPSDNAFAAADLARDREHELKAVEK